MIIKPRIRGFICTTAHPAGCAAHVSEQIEYVRKKGPVAGVPKRVLVIGASTGYGLASRIVPAFAGGAATIGVFFEKPGEEGRTHPRTGVTHSSTLKPIGDAYTAKTVNTDKGVVHDITLEAATEQEIADTITVMGGEDWEMWIDALRAAGVLADGALTVAYSYIGPDLTWAIYRNGTIGRAKEDLESTAQRLQEKLGAKDGRAVVSVNKALVTQASSAIPVVPLYISLLYKVMKAEGLHEGCIEQIQRLFAERFASGASLQLDNEGRVRIDDWEMRPNIQKAVADLWLQVCTENLDAVSDMAGYRAEFLKLFGFGLAGVDYEAEADPVAPLPSAQ